MGYEALHNAGHRKNELKNFKCGVFVGDSGHARAMPRDPPWVDNSWLCRATGLLEHSPVAVRCFARKTGDLVSTLGAPVQ